MNVLSLRHINILDFFNNIFLRIFRALKRHYLVGAQVAFGELLTHDYQVAVFDK